MREITLELLRHGPSHNQLLSPLTQYLALCENHEAVTVQIPFEHGQFLHRLSALRYEDQNGETRRFYLTDTARQLGVVLGGIPGLLAELSRGRAQPLPSGEAPGRHQFTHVRVVVSASELALLPFELVLTPASFPGAGQPLLLQAQEPVCLTREVRRVTHEYMEWPRNPRVLFAYASPQGVEPVPAREHQRALEDALEPWVGFSDSPEERKRLLERRLVVLENASSESLRRVCSEGGFSHVHILAHGISRQEGFDQRYGLALHDAADPDGQADIVTGDRLASILRPLSNGSNGTRRSLARPVAVTLASCDSGNPGSAIGLGASLSHALHAAGIPFVVGSQFPLSIPGSIDLVEILYPALLCGEDPRLAINDLRRHLHSAFPQYHDWASLAAYVSLPPAFSERLPDIQIEQRMGVVEVALDFADKAILAARAKSDDAQEQTNARREDLLGRARKKVREALERLQACDCETDRQRARVAGLVASTEKRYAEVCFALDKLAQGEDCGQAEPEWRFLLRESHRHYWQAFSLNRENSWGVVQYLSLDLLLRKSDPCATAEPVKDHNHPSSLWNFAHVLSLNELRSKSEKANHWALGNLVELYLLGPLVDPLPLGQETEWFADQARQRAQDLADRAGVDSFEVYSTGRQIERYKTWYRELADIRVLEPAIDLILGALRRRAAAHGA